jgi:hypothetical protein
LKDVTMQTFAAVMLALLSLFAGFIIEPPVARAASKSKAAVVKAAVVDNASSEPYRIATDEASTETSRRKVAVVLAKRVPEAEIGSIADAVRAKEKVPFERTTVSFYLPRMKIGEGAWATATFNPALKISIIGLRLEEEQAAVAEASSDPRPRVGVWLTAPPAAPGRLTIYREGAQTFAEWRLRNGDKSVDELVETRDPKGRRFATKAGGTDHYLLTWNGELELRDGQSIIATGEKLTVAADASAAKPAPVAAVKQRPRAASSKTFKTSNASDAGRALSENPSRN